MPKGKDKHLVRRSESEDAGTARIVRRAKQAIATGQEVVLPKAVVDRLVAGETPTYVLRKSRLRGPR